MFLRRGRVCVGFHVHSWQGIHIIILKQVGGWLVRCLLAWLLACLVDWLLGWFEPSERQDFGDVFVSATGRGHQKPHWALGARLQDLGGADEGGPPMALGAGHRPPHLGFGSRGAPDSAGTGWEERARLTKV